MSGVEQSTGRGVRTAGESIRPGSSELGSLRVPKGIRGTPNGQTDRADGDTPHGPNVDSIVGPRPELDLQSRHRPSTVHEVSLKLEKLNTYMFAETVPRPIATTMPLPKLIRQLSPAFLLGGLLAIPLSSPVRAAEQPRVKTTDSATEETWHHRSPASSEGRLVLDIEFGSIEVVTNGTSEVVLESVRRLSLGNRDKEAKFLSERPIQVEEKDGVLKVTALRKGGSRISWNFGGARNRRTEARWKVSVPERFQVDLDTAGGDIAVAGIVGKVQADTSGGALRFERVQGPIHGDTSGGPISVVDSRGDIHVDTSGGGIEVRGGGGTLHADTSGGPITVRSFEGTAQVETSGGGITLENIVGSVDASTSGGGIQAVLPSPVPGDVHLETSGGNISLKVPSAAGFQIDAESSGGGVSSEVPLTSTATRERDDLKGVVNQGGPKVQLRTSGGGIRIRKA